MPNDEKGDLENEEVLDRVWTGVLPVYDMIGEPVEGPYNRVKEVPEHVSAFVEAFNSESRGYAEAAAKKPAPVKIKEAGEEE